MMQHHQDERAANPPADASHPHPHGPHHGDVSSTDHNRAPHEDAHSRGSHDHDHGGAHQHESSGIIGWLRRLGLFHSHAHADSPDFVLGSNEKGIRAVKLSLLLLAATAAFQVVVVVASGSVALFADTIHNFTDALTALPLWLAFALNRRPASRRFTYGHGRAEDLAGLAIVLIILASALVAGYESYRKIIDPAPLHNIGWVIAAAVIGFAGNEAVAILRTRVGREIGSAALIADGQHARVDGLTSLAVLFGTVGVLAGAPIADPIVGALITIVILFIVKDSAITIWHRMMDAVDPELVGSIERAAESAIAKAEGARGINGLRVRWLGHELQAEVNLIIDAELSIGEGHRLAEEVRHALFHAQPRLTSVLVHVDPYHADGADPHELTRHHLPGLTIE